MKSYYLNIKTLLMKRTLLIGAALVFAATGFAQTTVHSETLVKNPLPKFQLVQNQAVRDNGTMNVRKAKSNGVYYKRPKGAYYQGFGLDGYGYYASAINFAPWTEATFENMNNNKAGSWQMYFYGSAEEGYPQQPAFDEEDLASLVVDGDFVWSQGPGYLYYTPTLTNRNRSYTLGEENLYMIYYGRPYYAGRILTDSIGAKMAFDDHQRYVYQNSNYSNTQSWGALSDNMYGSGVIEDEEGTLIGFGAYQVFDTPMSPLYIERAFAHGCSFKRKPIAEGDTIFCDVTNVVKQTLQNGNTRLVPGDKVIATMFAVASDTLDFVSEDTRNQLTIYDGTVIFSQRTLDEFGIETVEGVTVDPADIDENGFAFFFYGFDRPGVDFGIDALFVNDDVDDCEDGHFLVYDAKTGDTYNYSYQSPLAMKVGFEGMYDYVEVLDNDGLNVLRISNDGQSCLTDGAVSEEDGLPGAAVYTAQPWYDEDLNEYYEIVDAPEWLTAVVADESMRNEDGYNGLEIVSFICQPLPANVSGRSAVVYVRGRGFTAAQPIYLLQGDASIADAISEVSTAAPVKNAKVFNLNGQEVNKNVKGILIQNGKKYINK